MSCDARKLVRISLFGIQYLYNLRAASLTCHLFLYRFNYRSTHHLVSHGFYNFLNWFDERAWYPLGRIVGGTVSHVIFLFCLVIPFYLFKVSCGWTRKEKRKRENKQNKQENAIYDYGLQKRSACRLLSIRTFAPISKVTESIHVHVHVYLVKSETSLMI